jgi:glycosyltransferase involved in cell wall biosynthesis
MQGEADMLVSVIIPTRDRAELVIRAVASVLGQTHRALDVVVVDDGSADDTRDRLAVLDDPRLRVLVHPRSRGVSAARNAGLAAARGGYFALLDSDDAWLPQKVERLLAFARAKGYAICQNQEIWMRGGRRVNPGAGHEKRDGFFFEAALVRCLVSPSSVMFTREFYESVGGFDESLPACEDYDLWLRALVRHPVGLLNEWLTVRHGGRADQLSAAFVGLDLFRIRAMLGLLGRVNLTDWHRNCLIKELGRKTRVYVRGCLKNGRPEEAMRVRGLVADALGSGRDFPLGDGLGLDPGQGVGQGGDDVLADVAGGHDKKQVVAGTEGAGPGLDQHAEHAGHGLAFPADGLHQVLVDPDFQTRHRGA